ncbi:MAG TPA: adenylate kinase [Marmoricola sp.]
MPASRIVINGVTGSGKSTLAGRVADRLQIPCIRSDEIYWLPGWQQRPLAERTRRYEEIAAQDAWVVDSLPTSGRTALLARADLVVALDLPRHVSLRRLIRRTARRIVTREEICNGNTETLRNVFGRESIIVWHFRSFAANRRDFHQLGADPTAPPLVVLRSATEVERWLAAIDGP